jgi:tetratricopeptide (TPR) repeat protein
MRRAHRRRPDAGLPARADPTAVEVSIAAPRRADLHGRVVSALVAQGQGDPARLAHHAEGAGLVVEACAYATHAAADAERVGALRDASLQLERALRLGTGLPADERFELLLRYARVTNFSSRMDEALGGAEQAVALAEEMRDERNRGRALSVLAWALWSLQRLPEARHAAEEAVAALEQTGYAAELARAHASRIRMEAPAFDVTAAIDAAPRALALADRAGLEEVRIDVTISLGLAHGRRGDPGGRGAARRCARGRAGGAAPHPPSCKSNTRAVRSSPRS